MFLMFLRAGLLLLSVLTVTACASGPLRPQHWVDWRIVDSRIDQGAHEVRWTYALVLENRGREAADILRGYASVSLGTVTSSPEAVVAAQTIPAGATLRVAHTALFRSEDFQGTALSARKAVKWQFWGKYQDGHHLIMDAEVRP